MVKDRESLSLDILSTLNEKEQKVLELIALCDQPIGSWNLVSLLEENNINISTATGGRILKKLEKLGFLKKTRSQGREITARGRQALLMNLRLKNVVSHQEELQRFIDSTMLEDFMLILDARKAIEKETARKAAVNITDEEIAELESLIDKQARQYRENKWITQVDISFHLTIARASRNKVLEILYAILSELGQQSELFEYIRHRVKAEYLVSHRQIIDAIKSGIPERAEKAMVAHIEALKKDVEKYWQEIIRQREGFAPPEAVTFICRCEEVTAEEIEKAISNGATTMSELRRMTRAGMGLCQGRSCRRNVMRILAEKTGLAPADIRPATYRPPVRPVQLAAFNMEENEEEKQ